MYLSGHQGRLDQSQKGREKDSRDKKRKAENESQKTLFGPGMSIDKKKQSDLDIRDTKLKRTKEKVAAEELKRTNHKEGPTRKK